MANLASYISQQTCSAVLFRHNLKDLQAPRYNYPSKPQKAHKDWDLKPLKNMQMFHRIRNKLKRRKAE